jgi:murein DD-endopeptidase MepM/ murein hydrolase activator NlpD
MSPDFFDLRPSSALVWPVPLASLRRVGQSVLSDRDGKGRPHYGLDLFAAADTPILSAGDGRIVRVVDGRQSPELAKRRAGLWVDVLGQEWLLRYLHLGSVIVGADAKIKRGALIGFLADNQNGEPHLHFEIRHSKVTQGRYGDAVDPLRLLPPRRS